LIEVLSPSAPGRRRDRKLVRDRYERAGVAEYLIVDPQARSMEQFVLRGGRYGAAVLCRATLALASFPGVAIDLRAIW
jgi:Uma2 family endonuclease